MDGNNVMSLKVERSDDELYGVCNVLMMAGEGVGSNIGGEGGFKFGRYRFCTQGWMCEDV